LIENDIIFGIHPVLELLRAKKRKVIILYTTKPAPRQWHAIQALLPAYPIDIRYMTREALTRLADNNDHQGVVAAAQPYIFYGKPFDPKKFPTLVILDAIQDPRNVGAIIRSAYCTGTSGVLITKKQSSPLNAVAIKASAGLAEHIAIRQAPSAEVAAEELRTAGYTIYCGTVNGTDVRSIPFDLPYAIIIGNEGVGISTALAKIGKPVALPQKGTDISYNASVAAGLLLFFASSRNELI
jgi:23S rRNA (guanosine2251-2'-O)-methyltransferase